MKATNILFAAVGIVSLVALHCQRHTTEPLPATISGKAFFTGPTPVNQHHGIQVIAYLKSDTVLTPLDTTFTDITGSYSFGKPAVDGVYVLTAYFRLYYPDTLRVKFQGGRREEEIRDMYVRQKVRIKISTGRYFYRRTDILTFTIEMLNISHDGVPLPDENWFGCNKWNELIFASESQPESRVTSSIPGFPCHPPQPCPYLPPGSILILTGWSAPIAAFVDASGNRIGPGKYLFYVASGFCLPFEWNGRVLPIFEPAEVEVVP